MTPTTVTNREFVIRFLGIFAVFGLAISIGTLLGHDQHAKDQLLTLIGPPIGLAFFVVSLVPDFVWWGLLALVGLWLFVGLLQQMIRAAVHQALQERDRR
jgi:hypothetical protein